MLDWCGADWHAFRHRSLAPQLLPPLQALWLLQVLPQPLPPQQSPQRNLYGATPTASARYTTPGIEESRVNFPR